MPSEDSGAVLLIEAYVASRAGKHSVQEVERALDETRSLLEAPAAKRLWIPAPASAPSGTMILSNSSEAFSVLHRLRTELRAEPGRPPVALRAGLGLGDRVEGARLANDGLRSMPRKKGRLTLAMTRSPDANTVLSALCRTLDSLLTGWTAAQWQAIYRRDGGRTLQQIGDELGIAYQNVSKRLIAAQYSLYGDVLEASELVFSRATVPTE